MSTRTRTQALEALRGIAAQAPVVAEAQPSTPLLSPHAEPPSPARPMGGRPGRPPSPEETIQISLRLPKAWHARLRRRALEAAEAEERTVTPQEIVRRLVGKGLGLDG